MASPERFSLTLEATSSTVPAVTRLRRLLKLAIRVFGLRCIRCTQEQPPGRWSLIDHRFFPGWTWRGGRSFSPSSDTHNPSAKHNRHNAHTRDTSMSYVRRNRNGFSVARKVRQGDRWVEETVCWLVDHMTPESAAEGFATELARLEAEAKEADAYLATRDGCYDRAALWERHRLAARIEKLRTRVVAVRAYLAESGVAGGVSECGGGEPQNAN